MTMREVIKCNRCEKDDLQWDDCFQIIVKHLNDEEESGTHFCSKCLSEFKFFRSEKTSLSKALRGVKD